MKATANPHYSSIPYLHGFILKSLENWLFQSLICLLCAINCRKTIMFMNLRTQFSFWPKPLSWTFPIAPITWSPLWRHWDCWQQQDLPSHNKLKFSLKVQLLEEIFFASSCCLNLQKCASPTGSGPSRWQVHLCPVDYCHICYYFRLLSSSLASLTPDNAWRLASWLRDILHLQVILPPPVMLKDRAIKR